MYECVNTLHCITYKCILQELDRRVPVQQRVRAMKELRDIVATKRLEEVCL